MNAFVIGCEIEALEKGRIYSLREFPLHCTLVHWFLCTEVAETINALISSTLSNIEPFTLRSVTTDLYGDQGEFPVHTVEKTNQLRQLHQSLTTALEPISPEHTIPYIGNDYSPHVSDKSDRVFKTGSEHSVQRIYLAQAISPEECDERKVAELYTLAG